MWDFYQNSGKSPEMHKEGYETNMIPGQIMLISLKSDPNQDFAIFQIDYRCRQAIGGWCHDQIIQEKISTND